VFFLKVYGKKKGGKKKGGNLFFVRATHLKEIIIKRNSVTNINTNAFRRKKIKHVFNKKTT